MSTNSNRNRSSSDRGERRGTSLSYTEFRIFNGALQGMSFAQAQMYDPTVTEKRFAQMKKRFAKVVSEIETPKALSSNTSAMSALDPEHAELAQTTRDTTPAISHSYANA